MNKIAVICTSVHHQNTAKVVQYIAPLLSASVFDLLKGEKPVLAEYDTIIFASGIYMNTVHKTLSKYIEEGDFTGKKAIVLYTCGMRYRNYAKKTEKLLKVRGADVLGDVYCRGYDTFSFFEKIGGIAKGHPTEADMKNILENIQKMLSHMEE